MAQPDPTDDPSDDTSDDTEHRFDDLAADLDPPMAVVTTARHDERVGCLVGFHSQAGIEPRRYAVWLSKPNHTARVALHDDQLWFGVHFLTADQHDLARLFGAETGDEVDKFAACAWTAGPHDVPLLADCDHRFVGRRISLTDVGSDHLCLVLEPTAVEHGHGSGRWLRLGQVLDLDAGHDPDEPA